MHKGRICFCVFLIFVAVSAIWMAREWPFQAALFPLSVSIPLLILASIELWQALFGTAENRAGASVDMELSRDLPPEIERRRVIAAFSWIIGFIVSVYLIGFPLSVPLFIFAYLHFEGGMAWLTNIAATAITWTLFYALFQKLVHLQFEPGALQTWLGL